MLCDYAIFFLFFFGSVNRAKGKKENRKKKEKVNAR
jgi:hypothetical protein